MPINVSIIHYCLPFAPSGFLPLISLSLLAEQYLISLPLRNINLNFYNFLAFKNIVSSDNWLCSLLMTADNLPSMQGIVK